MTLLHGVTVFGLILLSFAPPTRAAAVGEIGRISLNQPDADAWRTVTLNNPYQTPVVVVGPLSHADGEPAAVRVRNVGSDRFQLQIDEWDYLDGVHAAETLHYLVVEAGSHTLPGGRQLQAGRLSGVGYSWRAVDFPARFTTAPVLISQVASVAAPGAVVTRQRSVSAARFQVRLQKQENAGRGHAAEQLHWVAVQPGTSELFAVGVSGRSYSHRWRRLSFGRVFAAAPQLLAAPQTSYGGDPVTLRFRSLDDSGVQLQIDEEQSRDAETQHTSEAVGFIVFADAGAVHGVADNHPPAVSNPGNQRHKTDDQVWLTINARDPDGDRLSYSATGLPPGLQIDAAGGQIGGNLSPASAGVYSVTVRVSDGVSARSIRFRWTVAALNPVYSENLKTGSADWEIDHPVSRSSPEIAGYADAVSYRAGDTLRLKVSLKIPGQYRVEIYRLGYYGGSGGRRLHASAPRAGLTQPPCAVVDDASKLIECGWATSYSVRVGSNWVSGMYVANLTDQSSEKQSQVWFAVRDQRPADIYFKLNFNTYLAYNNYGTGVRHSAYGFNSSGGRPAQKLSLDRPFGQVTVDPERYDNMLDYEYRLVRWLESQGYDVSYATDLDLHARPDELLRHGVFLSAGHDEYWSKRMRDGVETARDRGVHLLFLSANSVYWRVRFEPSSDGRSDRVMAVYKDPLSYPDPVAPTYLWRGPENNRPENALMGVMYVGDDVLDQFGGYDHVVINADDPYYANTGLRNGDRLFGLVGFEWDAVVNNGFTPPGLTKLSESVAAAQSTAPGLPPGTNPNRSHTVRYTAASGAKVFSSGSIQWLWGLNSYAINPPRDAIEIQQFTVNVLADMESYPLTPDAGLIIPN